MAAICLVSSSEICSASVRCVSVMVQKEATRWSGGEHAALVRNGKHFFILFGPQASVFISLTS